jgi:hypothetical protein
MKAYEATITKTEFVRELKKHQKADDFIRGTYFNSTSGKGCAVGCSLESVSRLKKLKFSFNDHTLYEKHLGIPEWLARVEDTLFEGMTEERSKTWPVEFAQAIHPGADLERVRVPFIVMLLEHTLQSMDSVRCDREKWPDVAKAIEGSRAAVKQMIKAQKSGDRDAIEEAYARRRTRRRSAYSAYSAAYSAASAAGVLGVLGGVLGVLGGELGGFGGVLGGRTRRLRRRTRRELGALGGELGGFGGVLGGLGVLGGVGELGGI